MQDFKKTQFPYFCLESVQQGPNTFVLLAGGGGEVIFGKSNGLILYSLNKEGALTYLNYLETECIITKLFILNSPNFPLLENYIIAKTESFIHVFSLKDSNIKKIYKFSINCSQILVTQEFLYILRDNTIYCLDWIKYIKNVTGNDAGMFNVEDLIVNSGNNSQIQVIYTENEFKSFEEIQILKNKIEELSKIFERKSEKKIKEESEKKNEKETEKKIFTLNGRTYDENNISEEEFNILKEEYYAYNKLKEEYENINNPKEETIKKNLHKIYLFNKEVQKVVKSTRENFTLFSLFLKGKNILYKDYVKEVYAVNNDKSLIVIQRKAIMTLPNPTTTKIEGITDSKIIKNKKNEEFLVIGDRNGKVHIFKLKYKNENVFLSKVCCKKLFGIPITCTTISEKYILAASFEGGIKTRKIRNFGNLFYIFMISIILLFIVIGVYFYDVLSHPY